MMQDYVRTSTYQKAIHSNKSDFENKVRLLHCQFSSISWLIFMFIKNMKFAF